MMGRTGGSQVTAARGYHRRIVVSAVGYVVVLSLAVLWLNDNPESGWRVPVALVPLLPIGYGLWSILRYFRASDELLKRIQLESLAFAFTGTAMLLFTYGFLEMAGFEPLSAWWVWTVMGTLWGVGSIVAARRYR